MQECCQNWFYYLNECREWPLENLMGMRDGSIFVYYSERLDKTSCCTVVLELSACILLSVSNICFIVQLPVNRTRFGHQVHTNNIVVLYYCYDRWHGVSYLQAWLLVFLLHLLHFRTRVKCAGRWKGDSNKMFVHTPICGNRNIAPISPANDSELSRLCRETLSG